MLLLSFSTFLPSLLHLLGYGWRRESFGILHVISVELPSQPDGTLASL